MRVLSSSKKVTKLSKDRKFGTDGVRGPVETTMNPLFVTKLGWAAGSIFMEEGISTILIGKDTRISGYMLESALQAGLISSGIDVVLLGPIPTPGVSYLSRSNSCGGIVISASHNLFEDNGIKFFNKDGQKISQTLEQRIESRLTESIKSVKSIDLGKASRLEDAPGRYIEFCKSTVSGLDLNGLRILLDCANGATYNIAPKVLSELGADVVSLASQPDGININKDCGSTNPEFLKKHIKEGDYDLGIGFDGDGDRILVVSKEGQILDGDDLLYILSKKMTKSLPDSGVVGTLMTNKALELHLNKQNIDFVRVDVGDKYVLEKLIEKEWNLGGEPSGHVICFKQSPTGDAIITALKFLEVISEDSFDVCRSLGDFRKFPQKLINLKVENPNKIITNDEFWKEVYSIEENLGDFGRVLVRPSGTEPLIRIMVEAQKKENSEINADKLAAIALKI
tara:strand:- start:79822 stop:81180 length:1359 start_codon:yes stop_codon:yes gene_type:complete